MSARINAILTTLVQQYDPALIHRAPSGGARLTFLADGLAGSGLLVIVADIPANNFDFLLRSWVDSYQRLYTILSTALFPSFRTVNLATADAMRPPVMVVQGEAAAIMQALAGFVVPYIAMRHNSSHISDAEIRGLMTYMLDDLEAGDLDRRMYDQIWQQCAQIISQLLRLPIKQYSLTTMKKPLFQQTHLQPGVVPVMRERPVPPMTLPETGQLRPGKSGNKKDNTRPMPMWFSFDEDEPDDRMPPVPGLPQT